jgi:elongation factor Ts
MAISANMVNELRQKTGAGMMDCKRALQETDGDIERAIIYLREKGMASAGKKATRVAAEGKVAFQISDDGRSGALAEINCETDFVARGEAFSAFCAQVVERVLADGSSADAFEEFRKDVVAKTGENVVVRRTAQFVVAQGAHGRVDVYQHMGGKIGVIVEVGCDKADCAGKPELQEFCREVTMHIAAASPQYLSSAEVPADVVESEKNIYRNQAIESGKPPAVAEKMIEGRLRKWFGEFCLVEQPWVREPKQTISALAAEVSAKVGGKVEIRRFARFQLGEGIEKKTTDLAAEVQAQIEASKKG